MGLDVNRFVGDNVDKELLCPICLDVLENPVQAPFCEHAFCHDCISEWLPLHPTCPVDQMEFTHSQLKPVPRILKNLLARLDIQCDFESHGCEAIVKLDLLPHHLKECKHNPKRLVACTQGCGQSMAHDNLKSHNCVKDLRALVEVRDQKIADHEQKIADHEQKIAERDQKIDELQQKYSELIRGRIHFGNFQIWLREIDHHRFVRDFVLHNHSGSFKLKYSQFSDNFLDIQFDLPESWPDHRIVFHWTTPRGRTFSKLGSSVRPLDCLEELIRHIQTEGSEPTLFQYILSCFTNLD